MINTTLEGEPLQYTHFTVYAAYINKVAISHQNHENIWQHLFTKMCPYAQ